MATISECIPNNVFRARPRTRPTMQYVRSPRNASYQQMPISLKIDKSEDYRSQYRSPHDYGYRQRQYDHPMKKCMWTNRSLYEPKPEIKLAALPSRKPLSRMEKVPGRLFQRSSEVPIKFTTNRLMSAPSNSAVTYTEELVRLPSRPQTICENRNTLNTLTSPKDINSMDIKDIGGSFQVRGDKDHVISDYYSFNRLPARTKKPTVKLSKPSIKRNSLLLKGWRKEIHTRMEDIL
ncbi:hypothetical protein LOTGIDRAFT_155459 [Lottia gigantea]|uniref:Uncharacterized protein n=1 Tax=Lottia gigantea TaxID=225164 RepID=V4B6H0_LOTGI|nr:hypothetical protein LOTGIDRAFT_155459 [Lottia gigantea]ESO84134.1 hypothetical protein LOTGIDRAFT_155459 [Lottia gigantea]